MKGLFVVEKNKLDILELPEPEIGPYDAFVEVKACGICNSTDFKILEGEFQPGSFPILLGHESIGQVVKVGDKVKNFKVGDYVFRSRLEDEHIPFEGGRSRWAGFVEKALVTDAWAKEGKEYNSTPHPQQVVPSHYNPAHAVALITLKENLSCLNRTEVGPGQSLAIVGTGPVAQAIASCAVIQNIHPVVVFGRRAEWEKRFMDLGVDGYAYGDSFPPAVQSILDKGGFDRAIEAVGARSALTRCLQVTKKDGKVNLYGIPPKSEWYDPEEEKDPRIFRGKVLEGEVHDEMLEWVDRGKINIEEWVSHILPFSEYQKGFDMVANKTGNKVVLTF